MEKLNEKEAGNILSWMTYDVAPKGYRNEVWIESEEKWFVGKDGAISFNGIVLSVEEWNEKKNKLEKRNMPNYTYKETREKRENEGGKIK